MELDVEREKIFWAKRGIRSDVSEVCSYHNSVYLTKNDANELNNLLMISCVISDNPATFVTEEVASLINMCSDNTQYNIKAVAGQKMSRVISKICHMTGVDKHPEYGKRFS